MRCILYFFCLILICACNQGISNEKLKGSWRYVHIENLNSADEDSVTRQELAKQSPFIRFSESNELKIIWGGKVLSQGKYELEGQLIRYTESLEGGTVRKFPFLIKTLTDSVLIFETMVEQGTRVHALKIPSITDK